MASQVSSLKAEFQLRIREAEALKLELGRAQDTLSAATGVGGCACTRCMQTCACSLTSPQRLSTRMCVALPTPRTRHTQTCWASCLASAAAGASSWPRWTASWRRCPQRRRCLRRL